MCRGAGKYKRAGGSVRGKCKCAVPGHPSDAREIADVRVRQTNEVRPTAEGGMTLQATVLKDSDNTMSAEPGRQAAYSEDLRWRVIYQRMGMEQPFCKKSEHCY